MKAYRVTVYAQGFYKYVNTLEQAVEVAGPLHFVGPEEGPVLGQAWQGFESEEAYAALAPALALIELVDLPN